jgi:YegS/Rv2252/BmrU family lipid kinase
MSKLHFIVNPMSGAKDKRALMKVLGQQLRHTFEVTYTERPGHATEIAKASDADVVVAVGGDGTVNEVARGLIGTEKALGIVPSGSGNGLAYHLGISRKTDQILKTLNDGIITYMDCGMLDGKPFFCTAGVGLDADVAWRFASSTSRGLRSYIRIALRLWRHFHPQTYSVNVDGNVITTPAVFVTVGNANQWGNQARIADQASVEDGLLNVVIVKPFHTYEIPILAAKLMNGRAHTSHRVQTVEGKHIVIDRQASGPIHFDGDPSRTGTHIEMEVVPHALRVLVPKNRDI